VKSIFEERLANENFDPNNSPILVEELTKIIRLRVKTGKIKIDFIKIRNFKYYFVINMKIINYRIEYSKI
jgi:hypothetical protein